MTRRFGMRKSGTLHGLWVLAASTSLVSCASTSGGESNARVSSVCLQELAANAASAPTLVLLANAVEARSERRVDQDAMRVVVRAPRHVSSTGKAERTSHRQAAMSQLLRGELTAALAGRWKLIDDPLAESPAVTHELLADFGEVDGDVALSVRLIDTDTSWVVATARSVVPMEEMPFLAALPIEESSLPREPLAEPVLPDPSPIEPVPGELIEHLAHGVTPLDPNASLPNVAAPPVLTDERLQALVGPAARRLGNMKRLEPR